MALSKHVDKKYENAGYSEPRLRFKAKTVLFCAQKLIKIWNTLKVWLYFRKLGAVCNATFAPR